MRKNHARTLSVNTTTAVVSCGGGVGVVCSSGDVDFVGCGGCVGFDVVGSDG